MSELRINMLSPEEARRPGDLELLPVFEDAEPGFSGEAEAVLKELMAAGRFRPAAGKQYATLIREYHRYRRVLFVGLGKKEELTPEAWGLAVARGVREAAASRLDSLDIRLPDVSSSQDCARETGRALVLAGYRFRRFLSEDPEDPSVELSRVQVLGEVSEEALLALDDGRQLGETQAWVRDLVNQPANRQSPEDLAQLVRDLGRQTGLETEVLEEEKIRRLGMEAFLAVAQASHRRPVFLVLRYQGDPERPERRLGVAGKAILYDTGGLSLKPTDSMITMKSDMAGGAAALGFMKLLASSGLKLNVSCVLAVCDNHLASSDYRPGDIVGSMGGKSIFVANTDAEGRLTLADAVCYLKDVEKADRILDIATLTGAAEVALGTTVAAGIATDDGFWELTERAAKTAGEKLWRLPIFPEHREAIKSEVADLTNSGGRYGGAITAGLFVAAFAGDVPFVHLDIAGPSWTEKPEATQEKGATGYGTATLYTLAALLAEEGHGS